MTTRTAHRDDTCTDSRAVGAAPILQVENVNLGYDELLVVTGVSLTVSSGELVGLVGGNGSGTSTILRAVSGIIEPRAGRILLEGRELRQRSPHQMAAPHWGSLRGGSSSPT